MKRIEAVIRPQKLRDVNEALSALGVDEVTVSRACGFGGELGHKEYYRGAEYSVDFVSKARLEVLVSDSFANDVVESIIKAARTGEAGDGLILVRNYADAVSVGVDDDIGVNDDVGADYEDCWDHADELPSPHEQMSTASFVTILSKLWGPALRLLARIISASFSA